MFFDDGGIETIRGSMEYISSVMYGPARRLDLRIISRGWWGAIQLRPILHGTTFAYNCHMQSVYAILTTRLQLS